MRKITAMILVLICLCAGCTVTEESSDVSENSGPKGESISERVQAPQSIQAQYESESGITVIHVDAEIIVPERDAFPVVEAIDRRYTDEEVEKVLGSLIQGEWESYMMGGAPFTPQTKPVLDQTFGGTQAWHLVGGTVDKDLSVYKQIAYSYWLSEKDGSLMYYPCITYEWGYSQLADYGYVFPLTGEKAGGCTISVEEAKRVADEWIHAVFPDYEAAIYGQVAINDIQNNPEYYIFNYTQMVEGIPVTWAQGAPQTDQYGYTHPQGEISIVIGDDGIRGIFMNSPWSVGEVLQEDSELLEFDQIMDIYEKIGILSEAALENNNPDLQKNEIFIDKIQLGYMAVKTSDGYRFTPVWDFFGHHVMYGTGGYGALSGVMQDKYMNSPYLTINAIDGTVIDREYGY